MDQMWLFYFDRGFAVVVPLPGGVHRLLTIEPKTAFPERDPTLEEMQTAFRRITDDETLTLTNPDWFSYTDLAMGIGSGLRDGRIILAGDVGNPVLPNGGQGMNTGIGDAFNLGWKLASVLRSNSSDALLNTYEAERYALRRSLQAAQFNSLKDTTLVTPKAVQALFRWFAEPLLNMGGEYKMAQAFSELMIHTRKSKLTLDTVGKSGLCSGDRALDADVVHNGEQTRIYDVVYRGGWSLLAFTGSGTTADVDMLTRAVSSLKRPDISTYLVSTRSSDVEGVDVLYDIDEVAHRVWKVDKPVLYLVRPDGHVGARVRPSDMRALSAYMQAWLPSVPLSFNAVNRKLSQASSVDKLEGAAA